MTRREVGGLTVAAAALMAGYYGAPATAFFDAPTAAFAQDATLGPVLAVISHPVADYAVWRAVYDAAAPLRDAAGITGAEVLVDPANPLMVVVLHRFPTLEAAQAFLGNPDLAAAMQQAGVTAPPTVILAVAS